ncbi:MAG: RNA polymerase factor sigma-54 [Rhodoferax sp.]|jgi:RNA polymerase sigma-54 factor|nr:RNA polymerase factor sigma-54 [Rhodoferax sp.]MCL4737787.1 RNA polymerase factor sigma-54 [Burkholderiaceae bacterium]MCP5289331.1 RNA polymerase factor sigma-54 [Burkholderiaceae bacterium]
MKPTLQVRLSQHLALTPQLQQSIRLLQLSTLELHQEVEQMLEANPFLDADDEGPTAYDLPAERTSAGEREAAAVEPGAETGDVGAGADALAELGAGEFGTTEREDWENGTERDDFDGIAETPSAASGQGEDDDVGGREHGGADTTLAEHLRRQALGMRLPPEDAAALAVLIDSLDADGYLADPLEEIAQRLAAQLGIEPEDADAREDLAARLRCALHWLQHLDPPGVGARTLAECLELQLRQHADAPAREVAIAIVREHLEALARRDMKRLVAVTGADEDQIRDAQALIRGCEPKPGRPFADAEANIVVPDVVVQRSGRGFKVVLNPDVMPRLRINEFYAQAMRGRRGSGLAGRLQEARWFVKNIQQRFDTILRVSQAIVERQKAFFSHGAIAMKPLVLREIADELGLHESTISRVTTAKYMATPQGTFELKYFFGSSLATEAGGNASSTAVRALIQQLVDAEDPARPLSDSQLSQMLEEQGIQVARRTVAKYREALKIAPAALRKTL